MAEATRLDGRDFHGISQSLSASQDDYILGHLRQAGALEVLGELDGVKRSNKQLAEDLLTRILLSGRSQQILAGCLTEQGKKWNREEADRNAAIFGAITDQEEKQKMRSAIVAFVILFFQFGETSSEISQKSSVPKRRVRRGASAARATSATSLQ
jgi:hypothetical protein